MTAPTRPISKNTWLGRPATQPATAPPLPDGYFDRGLLGLGGMGQVRLAHDQHLDREVALKCLRAELADQADLVARFEAEAALMARLDHPAVVAVHARGRLPDGRPWYAMRVVRGETLAGCLEQPELGVRTLLAQLAVVCRTVAYAHSEGVVHCDLKPDNVLIGPFGEVQVLDWGIARAVGERSAPGTGTPGFLAPEQRAGEAVQPATDVFALGRILGRVLGAKRLVAPELERVVGAATRTVADDRPSASDLAAHIDRWLAGDKARERARERMAEADQLHRQLRSLEAEARSLETTARSTLDALPTDAPPEDKADAWRGLDRASLVRVDAGTTRATWLGTVHAALEAWPTLETAHRALARYHHRACVEAEKAGDVLRQAEHRRLLEVHDRGDFARWLEGVATLTLDSEPSGARVHLAPMETRLRRRVPGAAVDLGHTPLSAAEIPAGHVVLTLEAEDRPSLSLPLRVEPGAHVQLLPPGAGEPQPVHLPSADALGDDCHVPAGWFQSGGDPDATDGLDARVLWVDDFAMERFPVTNRQWMAFLDHLLANGDEEAFWQHAPAASAPTGISTFRMGIEAGRTVFVQPETRAPWQLAWPVQLVSWESAVAYASWRATVDERPWRLPHDQEWEKAMRGTDGRHFPFGNHFEPSWARMLRSASPPVATSVHDHPDDISPYGVRHGAGNARCWCLNRYDARGPESGSVVDPETSAGDDTYRFIRGGSWLMEANYCRSAARFAGLPDGRYSGVGVRLVRSLRAR